MSAVGLTQRSRWRALLALLWRTARWFSVLYGVLLLSAGTLSTLAILATGALVAAVPDAVRQGAGTGDGTAVGPGGSPGGERAFLIALGGLLAAQGLLVVCTTALSQLGRVLDRELSLEVHATVSLAALAPASVAALEQPAFTNRLQVVEEADRRGVLRAPVSELTRVVTMRLRGLGGFVVLLAFRWWVPLVLAAAWHLTNVVYVRATARGDVVQRGDGAARMRRAQYLRSLAVDAPAAKEIRVFGVGRWMVGQYEETWLHAMQAIWQNRKGNRLLNLSAACAVGAAHAVVLWALIAATSRGDVTAAGLFVFVQAVLATSDLGLIGDSQWLLAQMLGVSEQVEALRTEHVEARRAEHVEALRPRDSGVMGERAASAPRPVGARRAAVSESTGVRVCFEGVRFTYAGRQRPTLDGLTLQIPAGQSLAIVGENGAGKSTLIKLLCGLYEPDAGRITVDGVTPAQARDRVGVIFQDFVRYKLPLRENVGFGYLPFLRDEAILSRALCDAGGAELLARLPKGWDTMVSREFAEGVDLSGGEWQRVALARALLSVRGGAGLLILDEPTASLDVRAETELFRRFLQHTRHVTTVLVSHRLSSVRHADRIVVLQGGRLVEDGTHDELMRARRGYATMFSLQARRFVAADDPHDEEAARA